MTRDEFQKAILTGIPAVLPEPKTYEPAINHAPKRKEILTKDEKKLAVRNALRYFDKKDHAVLAKEFLDLIELLGPVGLQVRRADQIIQVPQTLATVRNSQLRRTIILVEKYIVTFDDVQLQHPPTAIIPIHRLSALAKEEQLQFFLVKG